MIDLTTSPDAARARFFAIRAHGDQRYGEHPYVKHLDDVAEIVGLGAGEFAVVVAYLHDVIEDTETPLGEIAHEFGDSVVGQVLMITDPPGKNRKQRKALLYARALGLSDAFNAARIVKAADRLANVRECQCNRPDMLKMYRGEHARFREAFFRAGICDGIWAELDRVMG